MEEEVVDEVPVRPISRETSRSKMLLMGAANAVMPIQDHVVAESSPEPSNSPEGRQHSLDKSFSAEHAELDSIHSVLEQEISKLPDELGAVLENHRNGGLSGEEMLEKVSGLGAIMHLLGEKAGKAGRMEERIIIVKAEMEAKARVADKNLGDGKALSSPLRVSRDESFQELANLAEEFQNIVKQVIAGSTHKLPPHTHLTQNTNFGGESPSDIGRIGSQQSESLSSRSDEIGSATDRIEHMETLAECAESDVGADSRLPSLSQCQPLLAEQQELSHSSQASGQIESLDGESVEEGSGRDGEADGGDGQQDVSGPMESGVELQEERGVIQRWRDQGEGEQGAGGGIQILPYQKEELLKEFEKEEEWEEPKKEEESAYFERIMKERKAIGEARELSARWSKLEGESSQDWERDMMQLESAGGGEDWKSPGGVELTGEKDGEGLGGVEDDGGRREVRIKQGTRLGKQARSKGGKRPTARPHVLPKDEERLLQSTTRNIRMAPAAIRASVEHLKDTYTRNPRIHVLPGTLPPGGGGGGNEYHPHSRGWYSLPRPPECTGGGNECHPHNKVASAVLGGGINGSDRGPTHTPSWPVLDRNTVDERGRRSRRAVGAPRDDLNEGPGLSSPEGSRPRARANVPPARLEITVEEARRGAKGRRIKWCDPFCSVSFGSLVKKTKSIPRSAMTYSWKDQILAFHISADNSHSYLEVAVIERLGHYLYSDIGRATVRLNAITMGRELEGGGWEVNEWVAMKQKGKEGVAGEMLLLCRYFPEGSKGYKPPPDEQKSRVEAAVALQAAARAALDWGRAATWLYFAKAKEVSAVGEAFWNMPSVVTWVGARNKV